MTFKLKSGNKPQFKQVGSSPAKHYVDDVKDHNDGHSDDLQTLEEHKKNRVIGVKKSTESKHGQLDDAEIEYQEDLARAKKSPTKQVKQKGLGPRKDFGGVKNPELEIRKERKHKKVMKDGPKNRVHGVKNPGNWQPHQFRDKKSPTKQTDATYADGSKKSKREQGFSKRHTAEKAKQQSGGLTQTLLQKRSGLGPRAMREDDQSRQAAIVRKEQGSKKRKNPYWYKINGQGVSKEAYIKYENKPGNMEGGGKQTNNPDVYGRKANNHGRGPKTKK